MASFRCDGPSHIPPMPYAVIGGLNQFKSPTIPVRRVTSLNNGHQYETLWLHHSAQMSSSNILLSSQGKSTKRLTYALWRSICKMGWGWMIPHNWRSTLIYVCVVTTGVKHRLSLSLSHGGRRRMVFELCRRRQCCLEWTMIRSAGGCFRLYTSVGT